MNYSTMQTKLAGMVEDTGHTRWTAVEKQDQLIQAHQELISELYEKTEWKIKSGAITAVASTQEYDLPSDFHLARHVYKDSNKSRLQPLNYDDKYMWGLSSQGGTPKAYYIINSHEVDGVATSYAKIGFLPVPDTGAAYTVEYFPIPFSLSADDDVSGLPSTYHWLVIIMAARNLWLQRGMLEMYKLLADREEELRYKLLTTFSERQRFDPPEISNEFGGL